MFGRRNTLVKGHELMPLINHCLDSKLNLRLLSTTYTFPVIDKDRFELFEKTRIPNSTFLDIDVVADKSLNLPHMLPKPSDFNNFMKHHDISNQDVIFLYDDYSILGSARAWWMFKTFGFKGILE